MVIVLTGASGSGKTTIGRALATTLNWRFVDGDDYHTVEHIAQMRRGEPLTDADRGPWLQLLHEVIARAIDRRESTIVACSALKQQYRDRLAGGLNLVRFVHLEADPEVLCRRLTLRAGHFAGPQLLDSQLAALEAPADTLTLDSAKDLTMNIGRIREEFGV